jgi:two-component system, response regulator YesN
MNGDLSKAGGSLCFDAERAPLGGQNMPEKILVVDDEIDFREELKDCLENYEIMEAIKLLRHANEIALVILDVNLPGIIGTEVLREIKKTDPNLGIIILTGYSSKDVAIDALKGHADDYIEKPVDINKLKEVIARVLSVRRGEVDISLCDLKGKVEKVKQFIENNWNRKTCLEDAANVVCLSQKYLSRVFKQYTGKNFSEYKLAIKVQKAKYLLAKTGYNVNQVSDKLGYENTESFIRQFKKIAGCTPTSYRKKKRK